MNLDRIAARIRPRTPMEGIDLGVALARHWFLPLWGLWLLTCLPFALVLLLLNLSSPDFALFLIWWLKPLFEAPLLLWLSRALFDERPRFGATLKGLLRQLPLQFWSYLLWRRITPIRSFALPVVLLEGLKGRQRSERLRILQGSGSAATLLTLILVHLEGLVWLSLLLGLGMMIPDSMPWIGEALLGGAGWLGWINVAFGFLAMSLIAPFYVATGFALYLTRRTELEAWDLELLFRHLHEDRQSKRRRAPGGMIAGLLLALVLLPQGDARADGQAADIPSDASGLTSEAVRPLSDGPPSAQEAKAIIKAILADEAFGGSKEVETWVPIKREEDEEKKEPSDWSGFDWDLGWIGDLVNATATVVKWVLLIGAAAIILVLLARGLRDFKGLRLSSAAERPEERKDAPAAQQDSTPPPAPLDLPETVAALLASGDTRGALATLYRGYIAALSRRGIALRSSATEAECLAAVQRHTKPEELAWARRLVRHWRRAAYAHQHPSTEDVRNLILESPFAARPNES